MKQPGADRRWKNRPLVRERDDQRLRWLWAMLAGLVLALAPAGAYLVNQNSCLELSYEIEELELQRERLAEIERRLAVRRAEVASMTAIERWAARERGLIRPDAERIVVVPPLSQEDEKLLARSAARSIE